MTRSRAGPRPPNRGRSSKAPTGPTTSDADALEGPVPNLKSLPAWGIGISPNGNNLTFAATVWNAGNSPLVVDGFRVEGEDEMDAYQYFFDAEGNQTGYQPVGHFHWDAKPTHQHWHFKDFASYTLLREDMTRVAALEEGGVLPGQHRLRRRDRPGRRLAHRHRRPRHRLR